MRRLAIPGDVSNLARRAYQDAYTGLETDDQRAIYARLLADRVHEKLRTDSDRPSNPRDAAYHDAQTLVAVARQLEHVIAEVYEEEFPELPVATGEIIDIDTSIPEGAQSFVYYMYTAAATALFAVDYSTGDAPTASVAGASVRGNVEPIENSFGWHIRELRAANFAGIPIENMLAIAARRAHLELAQRTFIFGREDIGLPGFVTHPNINVIDAPDDGAGGSSFWADKSFDLIARDVTLLVRTTERISFGMRRVNWVLLPREEMIRLETTFLDTTNASNLTQMEALQRLHPGVTFRPLNELATSFNGGRLPTDSAIAYVRNRSIFRAVYPMQFLQHAPEMRSLETHVPCESSVGGVILKEPPTVTRLDGIGSS